MKHLPIIFWLFAFITSYGQMNMPEYKASNGITYHLGDTVKLGRGSAPNGSYLYVQVGGLAASTTNPDQNNLHKGYAGGNAVIKKIGNWKRKGADRIFFTVGVGLLANYYLFIEDAIATCEIMACKDSGEHPAASPDKYDQLKKLKELLDQGAITQEEYDKEKKKILDESGKPNN